jgi:hypothetical protein
MKMTQIEAVFKYLQSDLGIRRIYHQLENRVEAHIMVAFPAYCLSGTTSTADPGSVLEIARLSEM